MRNPNISVDDVIWFLTKTVENIDVGVYIRDNSGKILFANNALAKIHGYDSADELVGKVSWNIIDKEHLPEALESLKTKGSFQGEIKGYKKDGTNIILFITVLDMSLINSALGFVQDITEEKKTQKKLAESEAKYRALVDTIREGLIIVDADENIAFVNPALLRSLGYSKSELIGMNMSQLTNEENFEIIRSQTELRKKGQVSQYQVLLFTKDGEERTFLISAAPLYDSKNNYVGAISLCVNLSSMCYPIRSLSNVPKLFLKALYRELDEQLLRAKGWLDILEAETSVVEAKNRVKKVSSQILKLNYFAKQSFDLIKESLRETKVPYISLADLLRKLEKQVGAIASSNKCQLLVLNEIPEIDQENLSVPILLMQVVEHCLNKSFTRFPSEFKITFSLRKKGILEMECFDNGNIPTEFYEMKELPLENYYFLTVIMRELDGKYTYTINTDGKGLRINFIVPINV